MKNILLDCDEYILRTITKKDINKYYKYAFLELDTEAKYNTGTLTIFNEDQIKDYVNRIIDDPTRYDFLIIKKDKIIGEIVMSDISNNRCHYRICIYKKENFSKGIGCKVTRVIFKTFFEKLDIKEIELEVFPFNERAIALYKKMGFEIVEKQIYEDAKDPYKEIYVMRLFKKNFN